MVIFPFTGPTAATATSGARTTRATNRRRRNITTPLYELYESAFAQLAFDERVNDGSHDHAADAECGFADDDGEEDLPRLRVDLAADDSRRQHVLQLAERDDEDQRGDRSPSGHSE